MSYASLNFTLDLLLICFALGFLIRDYPIRTAVLTLMCVISYVVPLTWIEDKIDPPKATTEIPTASAVPPENGLPSPGNHPAPPGPGTSVTGLWSYVLNGLSSMPGTSGGTVDVDKEVNARMGKNAEPVDPALSAKAAAEQQFLAQRLGHHLKPDERAAVEMFWFLARCCMLAGAAYFVFADWKMTMGIVSLCVIPVHYYMVLVMFLTLNWKKTQAFWGAIGVVLFALAVVVAGLTLWRHYLLREETHDFEIPDPEKFRAKLNGKEYDFAVEDDRLKLADLSLDLKRSYLDAEDHSILRFQGGAVIEFVEKPESRTPSPHPDPLPEGEGGTADTSSSV